MTGPLHGYRVLDFTWIIAGPFATRLMAEFGADIIKVEQPGIGDFYRQGDLRGNRPEWGFWNYGKRSISIDLKSEQGIDLCKKLAAECDVVIENFRPGTLDRLGLGYDALREINPKIIYCSISGFGTTTNSAQRPLHAGVAQALSGISMLIGREGDPPMLPTSRLADTITALHATSAICASLADRERTGKGRRIEVPVMDTMVWMLGPIAEYEALGGLGDRGGRPGLQNPVTVPGGVFEGRDGWIYIGGGVDDRNWKKLAVAIERPDLKDHSFNWRRENQDDVHAAIETWLKAQPSIVDAEATLLSHDIICGKVNTPKEMLTLEPVREWGTIEAVTHRELGPMEITNSPIHFDGEQNHWVGPGPRLGEHNASVLEDVLGLDPDTIAALERDGVLFTPQVQ